MPPLKPVPRLQDISLEVFSALLAGSVSSLANGMYYQAKQKAVKKVSKSTQKSKAPSPQITMVVPSKELQRIKTFIAKNIPKTLRNTFFHQIIKRVIKNILSVSKSLKKTKPRLISFSDRLSQLDKGVMYVFTLLMTTDITELDFTTVLHQTMKWVDTCRLSNTDPKENALNYTRIEMIFLKNFAENTKAMTNVISLTWPHLISGDLLRVIGGHLPNLRILILACSCEMGPFIEEERKGAGKIGTQEDLILSLRALYERAPGDFTKHSQCGCQKLRRLILPNLDDEKGKAAEIIAEALLVLTHLEVVSGISTLLSLMILKRKEITPTSLSLKNLNDYDPFKQRTMDDVEFLKTFVPNLESLELRISEDLTNRILKQFHEIKEISIECSSFHTTAKQFSSLMYLNISLDFSCPWPLLLVLGKYCKHLKHLTLEHSTFKIDTQNLESMKMPIFDNLIFLKLIRSSFIEFIALQTLIKGCCRLQELYITLSNDRNYMVDEFGDQLIETIAPSMKNLERFTAECLYKFNLYLHLNCTLTIESAKSLIHYCPKLKFIGHLDSWDVKDTDIKEIATNIQSNNWDLEIA